VRRKVHAFSLIELLVVLGIIALLIGLLMPGMVGARAQARAIQCRANLRELGLALQIYQNENHGWIYPVGIHANGDLWPAAYGIDKPPHLRWPMKVFKLKSAPATPPYDPDAYTQNPYDPITFPAGPFTPPTLRCPADFEPWEAHSYVINAHLAEHGIRGASHPAGWSSAQLIVAGEKVTLVRDYYMQNHDFPRVVERYRHGPHLRSNLLYLDGHVGNEPMSGSMLDPWDVTTKPQGN
jgi:prepilin-type N-terminal cleavage/methylation domain-containing protein/prepilin-type processing-associated H-X9-DG protein